VLDMLRRLLLITAYLVLAANTSWAAIAYVNSSGGNAGSANVTTTTTAALSTTTGNFIAVAINFAINSSSVSSVTDTAGNTYHQCGNCSANSSNNQEDVWYAYNITGNASNVVTVNLGSAAQYLYVSQVQFSGVKTTSPAQDSNNGFATGATSVTTASISPSNANGLNFVSFNISNGPSPTAGGSYTILSPSNGCNLEYYIGAPAGSQTASVSWTGSQTAVIGVESFSPAAVTTTTINKATINYATIN
jgi:hypothetical protein